MKSLWFQARYVEPILSGSKTTTIRKSSNLTPGELVRATVGPRPAFATLRILSRHNVRPDEIEPEHRAAVEKLYPGIAEFVEIEFAVD